VEAMQRFRTRTVNPSGKSMRKRCNSWAWARTTRSAPPLPPTSSRWGDPPHSKQQRQHCSRPCLIDSATSELEVSIAAVRVCGRGAVLHDEAIRRVWRFFSLHLSDGPQRPQARPMQEPSKRALWEVVGRQGNTLRNAIVIIDGDRMPQA